ncbi:substrate-binding domain-containing protein [Lysobacter sp. K5869]|uniref:substrate-binding domain-containing protein n=1 Tax=Lysobacter sp. K5869 TaxID=2820808 RepID=UPI001C0612D1|nr:substrate-binding domain-containing protein [Lysobacter sp. K5869]QWP75490.1 substrate-binding domain-containing protein [Lysobacter sp. K5869]
MHRNKLHAGLLAATAVLVFAGSANAADLYGGGATFPAPAYVGDLYNSTSPVAKLSRETATPTTSTFPAVTFSVAAFGNSTGGKTPVFKDFLTRYGTDGVSYCQTGSGTGKKVLNNDGVFANGACSPAGIAGFSAATGQSAPDFIGTDAPISTADYSTFITNMSSTRSAIVQIPALAGAIALPFKDTVGGLTSVALNTEQVCRIFAGDIKDWTDSRLGLSLTGSHPITIVYRSEGSGTSFAFTSYLAAQCNGKFGLAADFFKPNQSYATAAALALPNYSASSAQAGNNGVVSKVKSTTDAFGYADIAEVLSQGVMYAAVNGYDPAKFGTTVVNGNTVPAPVSIAPTSLLSAKVLDGATVADVSSTIPAPQRNCLRLVAPNAVISSAYPIAAVTYVGAYYSGNGAKATALKNLFKQFYAPVPSGTDLRVALPTGYAYIDGNSLFRSSAVGSINSCIN